MLSILIPIYNFYVTDLVNKINSQAKECNFEYEIILIDDASEKKFRLINSNSDNILNVKYIQLTKNIGRSKIRNLLAEKAKFDYLLFMDSDSKITDNEFLKNYIVNIKDDSVIFGGTEYQKEKPHCKEYILRWYYGTKREVISAEIRDNTPYKSIMTNNFLIPKSIFQKIKFNESLSDYGHEDTLFGIELFKKGITVKHINNPLRHIGLDSFDIFLYKTESAVSNLIQLSKSNCKDDITKQVKLLKTAKKFKIFFPIIYFIFKLTKTVIFKNLKSSRPKLFLFDFYKLCYYFNRSKK